MNHGCSDIVAGPLAVALDERWEVEMSGTRTFACPACGAEFDVREALAQASQPEREPERAEEPPVRAEPVSFQCPACGADFETQEQLTEIER